jgi:hypothetical protein
MTLSSLFFHLDRATHIDRRESPLIITATLIIKF